MIRLENKKPGHNKFYEIYYDWGKVVSVRYGAIDTPGTIIKKNFSNSDAAYDWYDKQFTNKQSSGYTHVDNRSEYWRDRYELASKKLSSVRSAVFP